jgi:hypothetical protein
MCTVCVVQLQGLLYTTPLSSPNETESAHAHALVAAWPHVATRYNASVHGAFDDDSRAPLYTHDAVYWDTSTSASDGGAIGVGDGIIDEHAKAVYDTVWAYAYAARQLLARGISARNGV